MATEITKAELIEKERSAWKETTRRLEFLAELMSVKTDKLLIKDASAKLGDAMEKFKPLMRQRATIELVGK